MARAWTPPRVIASRSSRRPSATSSTPMRTRSSMTTGRARTGGARSAARPRAPRGRRARGRSPPPGGRGRIASSTLRNSQCEARSTSKPGTGRARFRPERGERGLGDRPPLRHRVDEPDGAELRDRRAPPERAPRLSPSSCACRAASSSIGSPSRSPRWCSAAAMRTVRSSVTGGVRRVEEAGHLEPAPVVVDGLVVRVAVLGVLGGAARPVRSPAARRRAAAPGRRGALARTGRGASSSGVASAAATRAWSSRRRRTGRAP